MSRRPALPVSIALATLLAVATLLAATLGAAAPLAADDDPPDDAAAADSKDDAGDDEDGDDGPKTLAETVGEDAVAHAGLVTFHRSPKGGLHLVVPKKLLGEELGLSALLVNAIGDWTVRGSSLGTWVVSWEQTGDRLFLVKKNLAFRAAPEAPLAPVVAETFPDSPTFDAPLVRVADDPAPVLIDASKLFGPGLLEILPSSTGWSTSAEDATLVSLEVHEDNVVARVRYRFRRKEGAGGSESDGGPFARFRGPGRVPDSRNVAVTVDYNLYRLPPDDGYRPRFADERIGAFTRAYKDFTDIRHRDTAFRHLVTRWDVRKADPSAAVSPPAKPIVFWVDRGVPAEWRPHVHAATRWWNAAFEKVGIRDAIEVRDQPDDPDWKTSDIDHSMIFWNLSDDLIFSGLAGPTFSDPRSGRVIRSNAYLNAEFPSYTLHRYLVYAWWRSPDPFAAPGQDQLFGMRPTRADLARLRRETTEACAGAGSQTMCDRSASFSSQIAFARMVLLGRGILKPGTKEADRFAKEAFEELVAHEVGHALGFPHNWKASLHSRWEDVEAGRVSGSREDGGRIFSSSVMDYNPIYLAPPDAPQGDYFMTELGDYDDLAVEYIYRPFDGLTPEEEAKRLDAIAARAEVEPGLVFDGGGLGHIDPTTNADDIGDDPLAFARSRLVMIRSEVLPRVKELVLAEGHDYSHIRQALDAAIFSVAMDYIDMTARHVGGQVLLRRVAGSRASPEGGPPPIRPVPAADQRRALAILEENLFPEGAFALDAETLAALKADMHRDWNYPWRHGSDWTIGRRIAGLYDAALRTLLEPARLTRVLDNERRVAPGEDRFTLPELLQRLVAIGFDDLPSGGKAGAKQTFTVAAPAVGPDRRALQRLLVKHLLAMALAPADGSPPEASQLAHRAIRAILKRTTGTSTDRNLVLDAYSEAHLDDLAHRIRRALRAEAEVPFGR